MIPKQNVLAEPLTGNHDPKTIKWYRYLKIVWKQKDIVVFKYLLSKLLYSKDELSEEDIVVLFIVWENVVKECATDPVFKERYFWLLFLTRGMFNNIGAFAADLQSRSEMSKELDNFFSQGRADLSAAVYFGGKGTHSVKLVAAEPQEPPPKNRIGVGYRDKGNAKDSAWDGSPSWQEVSMDEWFQSHNVSKSNEAEIEQLFQDLKVGNFERWQKSSNKGKTSKLVKEMKG